MAELPDFPVHVCTSLSEHGYQPLRFIGAGAFSHVFLVRHLRYQQVFCVKVVDLTRQRHRNLVNIGQVELSSLVQLTHPNIIIVFDSWEAESFRYLILEFAEGGSLSTLVRRRQRLAGPILNSLCSQLASAVAYCHSQDICHRDIKPDNVLIDRHGRPKLCDFGFAFQSSAGTFVCGSLPFMAPELLNSTKPADPLAADVWALGMTFYFMAVGKLPWTTDKPKALMPEVARGAVKIPADLPEHFRATLSKMLRPDASKRPTMAQVEKMGFSNEQRRPNVPGLGDALPPLIPSAVAYTASLARGEAAAPRSSTAFPPMAHFAEPPMTMPTVRDRRRSLPKVLLKQPFMMRGMSWSGVEAAQRREEDG
jgi:serine/threonine protein kinase